MFDFKKIENIVAGIQSHMAEQKKDKDLELLVKTTTAIVVAHGVPTGMNIEHIIDRIPDCLGIAKQIILQARTRL
jgi:hypothetical protein